MCIISSSVVSAMLQILDRSGHEFVYMYEDLPDGAPTPFEGGSFVSAIFFTLGIIELMFGFSNFVYLLFLS